jgi:hypothetical protein
LEQTIELMKRHGVKLIEVEELQDPVCFVSTQRVALIRAGMTTAEREHAIEWIKFAAATTPPA